MQATLSRYSTFGLCILVFVVAAIFMGGNIWLQSLAILALLLVLVGIYDLVQPHHAVRRNYPVIGNIRYLIEMIRPEIRQYLLESEDDQTPFSRGQRSLVYARAKEQGGELPFGTLIDVYKPGYEFISHSARPAAHTDPKEFRIQIGGNDCTQPYSASVFNISAMSFGALSANAIRALNKGAKLGNFAHDTGEGSISPYHRENGGDLIWELGSGYFGCRTRDGHFDAGRFAEQAKTDQVKMIEIKMSQGAKPAVSDSAKIASRRRATVPFRRRSR
jgi:glutamate synthase domain-containing protein 2